jgi:hypothetical protein
MYVVNLKEAVAAGADIDESGLQTRFDPRDARLVNITFELLPDVGFYLELGEVVILGYRYAALLGVHRVYEHSPIHKYRPLVRTRHRRSAEFHDDKKYR